MHGHGVFTRRRAHDDLIHRGTEKRNRGAVDLDAEPAEAPTEGSGAEPAQPWTATYPVLLDLCHLGVPPDSPLMQETARLVARNCRWEYDGLPFFAGEVDCCINAGTILIGTYLGVDVDPVVQRLVADQMPDGGWNCWGDARPAPSSFASTLAVIDELYQESLKKHPTTLEV